MDNYWQLYLLTSGESLLTPSQCTEGRGMLLVEYLPWSAKMYVLMEVVKTRLGLRIGTNLRTHCKQLPICGCEEMPVRSNLSERRQGADCHHRRHVLGLQ